MHLRRHPGCARLLQHSSGRPLSHGNQDIVEIASHFLRYALKRPLDDPVKLFVAEPHKPPCSAFPVRSAASPSSRCFPALLTGGIRGIILHHHEKGVPMKIGRTQKVLVFAMVFLVAGFQLSMAMESCSKGYGGFSGSVSASSGMAQTAMGARGDCCCCADRKECCCHDSRSSHQGPTEAMIYSGTGTEPADPACSGRVHAPAGTVAFEGRPLSFTSNNPGPPGRVVYLVNSALLC